WSDLASPDRLLAHIPHCAEARLYPSQVPDFAERPWDVAVIGNMNDTYYPHRVRLRDLAWKTLRKRGYRVRIFHHPGYKRPAPPDTFVDADYARELSLTKVVLTCSGHQRAAFLKYVEAPMAGALLGADIPEDRPFLRRTTMELGLSWTDERILGAIERVLDDEHEWNRLAKPAYELVRKYRTMDTWAQMFLAVCHAYFEHSASRIWHPEEES
ncbi:MAG: hypothetical protein Q8S13_13365, partial [Dehalococcoidia bacterium]|nr:hypothetical protein [Dehalococcoidia bacterium]